MPAPDPNQLPEELREELETGSSATDKKLSDVFARLKKANAEGKVDEYREKVKGKGGEGESHA